MPQVGWNSFLLPVCLGSRSEPQVLARKVYNKSRSQRHHSRSSSRCPGSSSRHHRDGSKSGSRHHSYRHSSRSEKKACWGCRAQVLEGKSLCELCYSRAVKESGAGDQQVEALVRKVIQESLNKISEQDRFRPYIQSSFCSSSSH